MAAAKTGYELKANSNGVSFWVGDREQRIEAGDVYETNDPEAIRTLEGSLSKYVKHAEKPAKGAAKDGGS